MRLAFRIYYIDGSTYDGRPENAPRLPVVAICWNDADTSNQTLGRPVIREWDIYIYSDGVGGWHGTNKYADLMNHLKTQGCGPGGVRCVLEGLWINNEHYKEILKRAETDPDFNRKSARDPLREDGSE
jgi:hypothetical protein